MPKGDAEIAAIATVVALALRGGCGIYESLTHALAGACGSVANSLEKAVKLLELGLPLVQALRVFETECDSPAAKEFSLKIQTANNFGASLADQLDDLAQTIRSQLAIAELSSATAAETKMLLPLVFLILPVTVLFALYPSLQILNIQLEGTL